MYGAQVCEAGTSHVCVRAARKVVLFQHTVSLEPFKIKLYGFHRSVRRVSGNKDWVAVFMASVFLYPKNCYQQFSWRFFAIAMLNIMPS